MIHWRSEQEEASMVGIWGSTQEPGTDPISELLAKRAGRMTFAPDEEIFGEGDPATQLCQVRTGAVRCSKLMSDGRRQITAFYLPGDVFGLESGDRHEFAAEAVSRCELLLVTRSAVVRQAANNPELMRELWLAALAHLQRAQEQLLLLGRKNAQERVATFLLEMAERLPKTGALELPMSRQDIADYLGLTVETVSRTLTQLDRVGLISIPLSRRIILHNRPALAVMNDCLAA